MRHPLCLILLAAIAVQASAQLTLPYSGTDPTATLSSFQITKSGTAGRANTLYITNTSNASDVLLVNTIGLGKAAYFSINNAANTTQTLRADSNGSGLAVFGLMTGSGRAGSFRITNPANTSYALQGQTNGSGPALRAEAGTGLAGEFLGRVQITSAGTALQVIGGSTFTDTATFATAVATQFLGGGVGLTGLSASNIASGMLNDARLSSNVALLSGVQTFDGTKTFSAAAAFTAAGSPFSVSATGLVSNLNADLLDGLTSTAFLQSVPVPLTLNGTSATHIIRGQNSSTANGSTGVYGLSTYPSAFSYGGYFQSNSQNGRGVLGFASNGSGINFGVYGQSDSTDGRGVRGLANAGSGGTYGGQFQSNSTDGTGVRGWASAASGTNYGVVGQSESISATAFAVYAFGRVGASGTKPFRIDHPFDPENKYLFHYSTEMPEPQNAYNGHVTTDANGEAWVQLPDYFQEINKDFEYQLTVVDDTDRTDFVMAQVARKIRENKFKIRTNAPNVEVSWRVEAKRNDLWVRKHGAPVEADKQGLERGKYQHPELYGKPEEMGINYRPEPKNLAPRSPNSKR